MVLELAANGILFFLIPHNRGLPEELALKLFYQVVWSIAYLHKYKIAHRDIKPENILLDSQFRIKICDFGWASLIDEKEIRKSVCGTPEYMPPEVIDNVAHDLKIDVWMLGVLLYEMLHGYTPYKGNHTDDIKEQIFTKPIVIN